jgi:predicted dehydrogenase
MSKEKKGFGIIGAGMIAGIHADALRHSEKAYFAGAYDINPEAARKLTSSWDSGARVYSSVEEMLADKRVEVVNVSTPNHLHTPFVLKAAAAGKHVLCEKPPAMSLEETDRMIAACHAAGVRFGIFVQSRVRHPARSMKQALAQGRFGKVLRVEALMKWYREPGYYSLAAWRSNVACGAGVTIQQAFHYYDLLQSLMGPATRVRAEMTNIGHPGIPVEDTLDARITFANGVAGTVFASTALWPGFDVRIELYGTEGCAIMEGTALKEWKFKQELPEDAVIRAGGTAQKATGSGAYNALQSEDHQFVIDDCVDAINEGREVCIPCSDVRASLEMALAMYYSDKVKAEVSLPLPPEADLWKPAR